MKHGPVRLLADMLPDVYGNPGFRESNLHRPITTSMGR